MYFTDLNNPELQLFHQIVNARNMSVSLDDMLNSDLFKVTTHGNLYKIFPLFYCKKIECDNSNVHILDNKCIIAPNDETLYIHFITDEDNEDIVMFEDSIKIFDIGDDLTTEEFNAYIQLLRCLVKFNDNIHIADGVVEGTYANYQFNLTDVTIVDNGILITEETLSATPTVRLLNPVFSKSSYTLKLDVFSVSDVNIMDDYNTDNITHETITIPLTLNTDTEIELTELDFNKIILFNATVEILHDEPIIEYTKHLSLECSGDYYVGETITLTAEYDQSGTSLEGETITFYDGETSIGTATTNSSGVATKTYILPSAKEYSFHCKSEDDIIASINPITVIKQVSNITFSSNKSTAYVPTTFIVSGVLTNTTLESTMSNFNVKLYNNGTLLDTLTTDSNGAFSKTITADEPANYQLRAVFEDTSAIIGVNSSYVNVTARKLNMTLTGTPNATNVYPTQTVTFTGKLTDELGASISGATVKLMNGTSQLATGTTGNDGTYTITHRFTNEITYSNLKMIYEGDNSHNSVTKNMPTIYCYRLTSSLTVTQSATNIVPGTTVTWTGVLSSNGQVLTDKTIKLMDGSTEISSTTTNSNGEYTLSRTFANVGTYSAHMLIFNGDITHGRVQKSGSMITCTKISTSMSIQGPDTANSNEQITVTGIFDIDSRMGAGDFNTYGLIYIDIDGVKTYLSTGMSSHLFLPISQTVPALGTSGTRKIKLGFVGTSKYAACESETLTVKYKIPTKFDAKTTMVNGIKVYQAKLLNATNNTVITGKTIKLSANGMTTSFTSSSNYVGSAMNNGAGDYTWTFDGDNDYVNTTATGS